MLCWRHEHEGTPARLARGAAATCLGAEGTGLETARHRRCARGDAWSREPVAHARTRAREQGVEGLRRHPAPGRQPRLSAEHLAELPALVEAGAEA
jgi:hypothetical protein